MIDLRDFQNDLIGNVRLAMRRHRNVLLQSATGSGKTVMAAWMAKSAVEKGGYVFFICHRRELLDQTAKTFDEFGIKYSFIAAGYPQNHYVPVQICSIDTLKNRLDKVPVPTICLWDECHHLGAAGWGRVHSYYEKSWHIGLSATPQRLDGKGLDEKFDILIPGPPIAWLIDEGYLSEYTLFSVPGADMTGVHTRMGDFVKSETEQVMDNNKILGDIVSHWRKHAHDKLTIGFGVTRAHSQHIAAQFRASGIPAVHLDAETHKSERRETLRQLARGDVRVVFNVGLFGEGYDLAANSGLDVAVGCVIDAAPTQSLGAYLQRCGRALRPQPGKAVILDHAGNALRHGLPCEEREWTLEGVIKEQRDRGDEIGLKTCPECYAVFRPAPKCPECGAVMEVQGREIVQEDGELEEFDPGMLRRQRAAEQGRASSERELIEVARRRGIKNPESWARHIIDARLKKQALQRELFNLTMAGEAAGVDGVAIPLSVIERMKPKELRAKISELSERIQAA